MLRLLLESEPLTILEMIVIYFCGLFRFVNCAWMKFNIDCLMATLAPRKPQSLDPIL